MKLIIAKDNFSIDELIRENYFSHYNYLGLIYDEDGIKKSKYACNNCSSKLFIYDIKIIMTHFTLDQKKMWPMKNQKNKKKKNKLQEMSIVEVLLLIGVVVFVVAGKYLSAALMGFIYYLLNRNNEKHEKLIRRKK